VYFVHKVICRRGLQYQPINDRDTGNLPYLHCLFEIGTGAGEQLVRYRLNSSLAPYEGGE